MNVRIRNADAGTTSRSANHHHTRSAKTIAANNARYGTTDVARSSTLRPIRGCVYASKTPRHERGESVESIDSVVAQVVMARGGSIEKAVRSSDGCARSIRRVPPPGARRSGTPRAAALDPRLAFLHGC